MRREGRQTENCENVVSIHGRVLFWKKQNKKNTVRRSLFLYSCNMPDFSLSAKCLIAHLRWAHHMESSIVLKLFLTQSSLISWRFSMSWPGFLQLLVDFVVSLQRCEVEIMESLSESRLCQSGNLKMTLNRLKMHFQGFLQTCSTSVIPLSPLKPGCGCFLPVCRLSWTLWPCVSNQPSVITFFYLECNGTSSSDGHATALHRFVMKCFSISWKIGPSATETFVAVIKQTTVEVEKKIIAL